MKKIILAFSFLACYSICQAQVPVPSVDTKTATSAVKNFVKPPAIGDIGGTTSGIVTMLTNKLMLPAAQQPKLTDAISGFLASKKNITSLADTDPTAYLSKFNPLQKGLFGKMKGIMGSSVFNKFLALKPSGSNITGNVLSHLFF
jgi:hypothetical protein